MGAHSSGRLGSLTLSPLGCHGSGHCSLQVTGTCQAGCTPTGTAAAPGTTGGGQALLDCRVAQVALP